MTDQWHYELTPLGWCVFRHAEPQMWFFPDQWGRCPSLGSDDIATFGKLDDLERSVKAICSVVVALTARSRFGSAQSHAREVFSSALVDALNAWEGSLLLQGTRRDAGGRGRPLLAASVRTGSPDNAEATKVVVWAAQCASAPVVQQGREV